jgi:hypothetical protein
VNKTESRKEDEMCVRVISTGISENKRNNTTTSTMKRYFKKIIIKRVFSSFSSLSKRMTTQMKKKEAIREQLKNESPLTIHNKKIIFQSKTTSIEFN